jgi:hypothetical protein
MYLVKNLFLIIDTCFKIESQVFETVIYRNPKETDWAGYRKDLSALIGGISKNIRSRLDLELATDKMQQSILLKGERLE